jgi:2-keto-4-pentenoate hydratase/2-oxohepta-3-ene-1,7-dioic acid hydratase in catechol pathway
MKLMRFGGIGKEKPGLILSDGTRIDTSAFVGDYDEEFFEGDGIPGLENWARKNSAAAPRVEATVRLGAPIARPSKIVCVGLNFRDHAAETGSPIPSEPVLFFKATSSLVGPNDPLVIPRNATKVDWEVELEMWLKVNGEYRQKSTTANMIFNVSALVSYLSEFMTLLPGDVISTGTPPGVALGMHPPKYLRAGDAVELAGHVAARGQGVRGGGRFS